jgi:hypothetical protein
VTVHDRIVFMVMDGLSPCLIATVSRITTVHCVTLIV